MHPHRIILAAVLSLGCVLRHPAPLRAQDAIPDLSGTWVRQPPVENRSNALEITQDGALLRIRFVGDVMNAAKTLKTPDKEVPGRIQGRSVDISLFTEDYKRTLEEKGFPVPRLEAAVSSDDEQLTLVAKQDDFEKRSPNPDLIKDVFIAGYKTELGTFVRLSCARPTVRAPAQLTQGGSDVEHLNWKMNLWISPSDGLVVRKVSLGRRFMAERISVPYVMVRVNANYERRCELKAAGDDAECRSRLIDAPAVRREPDRLVAEATFAIDRISGLDTPDPASKNCLVVTQRYEFEREIDPRRKPEERYEPLGEMPHAKFRPTVRYRYYTDGVGPTESFRVKVPQRFHFRVDGAPANAATVLRDCEIPRNLLGNPIGDPIDRAARVLPDLVRLAALLGRDCIQVAQGTEESPREVAIMKVLNGNPLRTEVSVIAIGKGAAGRTGVPLLSSDWDNYHQTSSARVSLPVYTAGFRKPGCPECLHMHWRWPEFASLPPPVGGGDRFGHGHPLVPAGSNQFATLAVVSFKAGEEDPGDAEKIVDETAVLGADPVFWLTSFGTKTADSFFTHGGAFSSLASYIRLAFGVSNLPVARVGAAYDVDLGIQGGLEPYSVGGATARLPEGLRFDGNRIVGTPSKAQTSTFLVRVIDHAGAWLDRDFTIEVKP